MCDGVVKGTAKFGFHSVPFPYLIGAKPPSKPQHAPCESEHLKHRNTNHPANQPNISPGGKKKTTTIATITIYLPSFPTSCFSQAQGQWSTTRARHHTLNAFPTAKATDRHPLPHAEAQVPCSETPQCRTNPRSHSSNYTSSIRQHWQSENWRRDGRGSRRTR